MASTGKCEYCGSVVRSDQMSCPHCGAPNPNYVGESSKTVFLPKTIEELKEYCAERNMPLLRMRFFIGEDFREPKAFGIYRDGDQFIVYKNKADGTRAVRYQGTDEAYAVNELFAKLLDECHNRGIYPDGKPDAAGSPNTGVKGEAGKFKLPGFFKYLIILWVVLGLAGIIISSVRHRHDGYYRHNDFIYYNYGSDWYMDTGGSWVEVSSAPAENYGDYYLGSDYDSDWGGSDFKDSAAWDRIQESHSSSSSDFDSWDSSDTDWDSDW